MTKNKDFYLNLVQFPYFFNYHNQKNYNIINEKHSIDYNIIFWDSVFSQNIIKYVNLIDLSIDEKHNLKYIFKNLVLAKNIFLLFSDKNIGVQHLFFAFNII
jgi:hypothetical protein